MLTTTDGVTSKIFNAATTWLSIFDLRTDTWLLDTVVEADGEEETNWYTRRPYQVQDAGRTVVLGPYRDAKGRYQMDTLTGKDRPRSNYNLSPGTCHLRAGCYRRVIAAARVDTGERRLGVPARLR